MARQITYAIKQMHELFHQYLMEKFDNDIAEVYKCISMAETALPFVFKEYFDLNYDSIYDIQDENEIDDLRRKIVTNPVLRDIDKNEDPRYTDVLKFYRRFIKSLHNESVPLQVPGEDGVAPANIGQKQKRTVEHDDADYAPDTEGVEHQYNLTKKERNPELRQKCIEFYKQKWSGHIRCLCCGFDFGKAYENIGEGYIEIHHVNPHHTFEGKHMVDPLTDLIPLCSNCHSMIHRVKGAGKCMTLKELKSLYKGKKYNE